MLVEFSVENYRSIRNRAVLSLAATRLKSGFEHVDKDNVIECTPKLRLLRCACIYGANASGKSNLIRAFFAMRNIALGITGQLVGQPTGAEPFLLDAKSEHEPTKLEAVFLIDGHQYRYGLEVTSTRVMREWLYVARTVREAMLFTRDVNGIQLGGQFAEGRRIKHLTRHNTAFLAVAAQLNGKIAATVIEWFAKRSAVIFALDDAGYLPYTLNCIEQRRFGDHFQSVIQSLGLGISALKVSSREMSNSGITADLTSMQTSDPSIISSELLLTPRPSMTKSLITIHRSTQPSGKMAGDKLFDAHTMESQGTLKAIGLLGPLLDALSKGTVLFIDEIDARLHPLITMSLVEMFNSPRTNPHNAQLVCVTHDTNLLDRRRFRRDQIYFTEKDRCEVTHLYSLAEFKISAPDGSKAVRNDASLEKNYIDGRYGAIPYLGDIGSLFVEEYERMPTGGLSGSEISEVD